MLKSCFPEFFSCIKHVHSIRRQAGGARGMLHIPWAAAAASTVGMLKSCFHVHFSCIKHVHSIHRQLDERAVCYISLGRQLPAR